MSNPIDDNSSPSTTAQSQYPFEFRGNGFEYFKIWIVNILLTILTLYVYSAWAKVRTNRYFYGNTYLDNSSFEYHVKPLQILLSRMVAAVLFAIIIFGQNFSPFVALVVWGVVMLLFPWAMWRSLKFNSFMSSYRNIRFGFDGKLGELYLIVLGIPVLSIIVLALVPGLLSVAGSKVLTTIAAIASIVGFYCLFPWFKKLITSYKLNNYRYGRTPFSAELATSSYIAIYGKAVLLFFATLLILILLGVGFQFAAGNGIADMFNSLKEISTGTSKEDAKAMLETFTIFFIPLTYVLGFLLFAYVSARTRNYALTKTMVGTDIKLQSNVGARALTWLIVSNLLMVIFSAGLAYPWAKVRAAKFYAKNTNLFSKGSLDHYVADEKQHVGALGEELGDVFDMDISI